MKGLPLLIIVSLLFVTSSCNHKEAKKELIIDNSVKQIIFFSNHKQYEQEVSYYDAIIELKRSFPEEIKKMKIITASESKNYYNNYEVENCPAILLVYQDEVLVEIKGNVPKEQIVKPMAHALDSGS
ncbi:small peptidoglycan-associated lipoprotein [Bacillus sp. ISL-47]|uniref:small peptidoglycan-associated lipoprotein n=1 Tax=Bacillus sp. ISL-47 TaxID=2819130 RepID=UPI001BE8F617|nr:small peptidoglycan-associated lipoprotein [Bacillus sp. ISL-47]MBT2687859.1 small peptidoglycan-associated lipoprotein [Bacillus sp. ISL-47]